MEFNKSEKLIQEEIPFGIVEVRYPPKDKWDRENFYSMVDRHIEAVKEKSADYNRKAVFGENPYYRFFKKFKKTYPVMMQLESILLKGRDFPKSNPITEVAFLTELETHRLLGTHDADRTEGTVQLFIGEGKVPFTGLRGEEIHTYSGDFCGRDDKDIIFSMIAGADNRTCVREDSLHVFYPVFGVKGQNIEEIKETAKKISEYAKALTPDAETKLYMM